MSEKAPLDLGSNFDGTVSQNENIEEENGVLSKLREFGGNYIRSVALLGALVADPIFSNTVEAQSTTAQSGYFGEVRKAFHRITLDIGKSTETFSEIVLGIKSGEFDEEGGKRKYILMLNNMEQIVDGFNIDAGGGVSINVIKSGFVDDNKEDLILLEDDLVSMQKSLGDIKDRYALTPSEQKLRDDTSRKTQETIAIIKDRLDDLGQRKHDAGTTSRPKKPIL